MGAPSYTTDLQTVNLAETTDDWAEIPSRKGGGAPAQENRAYIQGDYCVSQSTGAADLQEMGLQYDYGGNIGSWISGWTILMWQYWQAPKAMNTWALGGMRIGIGSGSGDIDLWNAQGNDYGRNPYGGWANVAIDPEFAGGYDERVGSPTPGEYRYFWSAPFLLSAVSKGNPHCVDAIRYGRAELIVRGGNDSSADFCTFLGMAAANDADLARWGLFQEQFGTYLWKGLMTLGESGTEVDFFDSNRVIIVDDTPRTYRAFNRIEINDVNSIVDWSSISFISTAILSPGQFEVIDDAVVNMDGCSFTDMDTFIFQSNSTIINTIFQGCGPIAGAGGIFTGSKVLESSIDVDSDSSVAFPDKSAFIWDVNVNPDGKLDDMTFVKGANTHHAIEFGTTSPTTMTIRGMTTSGFNSANDHDDSTFHILRDSGDVTINVVDGVGNFSYRTEGANVTINTGKTLTLTGLPLGAEITIMRAGDDSSAAELYHLEDVATDGEAVYSFNDAGVLIDILVMHLDYEFFQLTEYELPATNTELPITLIEDRNTTWY